MITPQEAYVKGIVDTENNIIRVFRKMIEEEVDEQFPNPEMEKLKYDILNTRKTVDHTDDKYSIDYICEQIGRVLKGKTPDTMFHNPKLQNHIDAISIQLEWMHEIANTPKSNVGKFARKAVDKSLELLDQKNFIDL